MITKEEAYDIISNLNEQAHQSAWDTWVEADDLLESDNEADWEYAEEIQEQASQEQAECFREEFHDLEEDTKKDILYYVNTDVEFKEEFSMWYGEENFISDFK